MASNRHGPPRFVEVNAMALLAWLKDLTRRTNELDGSLEGGFAETLLPRHEEASKDWLVSSIDLHGLEVSEQPMNTLPGELRDELLKPHRWRNSL